MRIASARDIRQMYGSPIFRYCISVGRLNAPDMLPVCAAGVRDRADTGLSIPAPAAQQHQPRLVQRAYQRKRLDGVAEDRPVEGLVEHAPDRQAGVITVA